MKRNLILSAICAIAFSASAMAQSDAQATSAPYKYEFTIVKENPATPVKDQASTGTCWCFATNSFIESELLRTGKGEHDLSEMFVVRHNYIRRIKDNILRRGEGNIGPGSIAHMYIWVMKNVGIMPEEAYDGINYDSKRHDHSDLNTWVKSINATAVEMKKPLPEEIVNGVLDAYLGKVPEKFTYQGKEYTVESFTKAMGLNADDYVEITSFTHHPFYEKVMVEVPDNWDYATMYNLPLDEMMQVIDNAINEGYTVAWDGDISEPGYAFRHFIAVNTKEDLRKQKDLKAKAKEESVTQESRQHGFETYATVDDHLEHITGIAKDQDGVKYYKTKNSWGVDSNGTGYHYLSEEYVKAKTISILVHKNSIPKAIRAKLGLK
ncbi:MAG: aminopeptidase [Alistipes sp.]|nr:aminopeptidase [Alistipes sp.]MBR7096366.1 aminopeptidase [Alistipes sp.]